LTSPRLDWPRVGLLANCPVTVPNYPRTYVCYRYDTGHSDSDTVLHLPLTTTVNVRLATDRTTHSVQTTEISTDNNVKPSNPNVDQLTQSQYDLTTTREDQIAQLSPSNILQQPIQPAVGKRAPAALHSCCSPTSTDRRLYLYRQRLLDFVHKTSPPACEK